MTSDYTLNEYFDYSQRDDILSGGVKKIIVQTPYGEFKVWTKRIGNNPKIKVLLLHGGAGASHEYLECFDSFFPREGFEYYYYDQLGSFYSDQPKEPRLWTIERFVNEVEQVRSALNLNKSNFYLYGQSWGGILAMEYALKYQDHVKGLIISNMMMSSQAYEKYAREVVLPQMKPEISKEFLEIEEKRDFTNPRYMELLMKEYIPKYFIRMEQWPDPVNRGLFTHVNGEVNVPLMGINQFKVGGELEKWDRTPDLPRISIPTLFIGAKYDFIDPEHIKMLSTKVQQGEYVHCPKGSHLCMYDDQEAYFNGLITFIHKVDEKS